MGRGERASFLAPPAKHLYPRPVIQPLPPRDLTVLFAVALGLRLVVLATTANDPIHATPMLDAEYLVDWAREIARGRVLGSPEGTAYFRLPLHPWLLAIAFGLPGPDLLVARLLQVLLGAAAVPLLASVAARRFGRLAGWTAGLLAATAWPAVLFGSQLLIESIAIPLGALVVFAWDRADARSSRGRFALLGLAIGLATLSRPNWLVLLLPALVFVGAAPGAFGRRAAVLLGALAFVLPITVRNVVVSGEWVPLSYQGGVNLWIGNNPDADGMSAQLPGFTSWRNEDVDAWLANELGHAAAPREHDAWFRGRALAFFRDEPGRAALLLLKKTYYFWQGYEIRNNRDLYALRERTPPLGLPLPDFGWIGPLSVLGMIVAWRRRAELAFLYGSVLVLATATILFFVCARYRLPVWPFLLPFAGAGVAWIARRPLSIPGRAARVAACAALVLLARVDFAGIRSPDPSQTHFQYGNVFARIGDGEAAEREFRSALELVPGFAEARHHLGALYLSEGRIAEAVPELAAAAAGMPRSFRARRSLAEALEHAHRFDDALSVRQETARLSARSPEDVLALANAWGRVGGFDEAARLYDELRASPLADDPYFRLNAGQTALRLENEAQGLADLGAAATDDATREDAYVAMANYHLSTRRTTDALRILSDALLHVPESVPLHRLRALARYASGDATGALEDLEFVVAHDPSDDASRTRLEDVRAGRAPSR